MTALTTQLLELTHLTDLTQLTDLGQLRQLTPVKRLGKTPRLPHLKPLAPLEALLGQVKAWAQLPQNPVTLIVPVERSKEAHLRDLLQRIGQDTEHNAILPFAAVADHLHFARFLILDGADHPHAYDSKLVFLANVDGSVDQFLEQLIRVATPGLDQVFANCRQYPARSQRTGAARLAFFQRHLVTDQAYYINTIGRTVQQIRQEDALHQALRRFVNDLERPLQVSASALRQSIVDFVASRPDFAWALQPVPRPGLLWQVKEQLRFVAILVVAGVVVFLSWPALLLWLATVNRMNLRDEEDTHRPPLARLDQLRAREDILVHNQFAAVGFVKPGWIRRLHTRALLTLGQLGFRHLYNNGDLATVRLLGLRGVNTIHFARWIFIDDGKRLLFASNYDGSLESYMVDFIDKVAWGINLVFSNGVGFPRTRWLVAEGARKEQRYKDYLGNHQIETLAWHSPYPQLTAANIANNEAIRAGLRGRMTEKQARAWLQRIV